jgi:NAD(P)-dependent dehydrogenase (short-subunit alcohol dehydrogenase family)
MGRLVVRSLRRGHQTGRGRSRAGRHPGQQCWHHSRCAATSPFAHACDHLAGKFGRIINISSINGQKGQFGQTNYSAAKAGEIGFTKALAQECARVGITVNAIARPAEQLQSPFAHACDHLAGKFGRIINIIWRGCRSPSGPRRRSR